MSTTTETPPRFQRRSARGFESDVADPLPPSVQELDGVQEPYARHRELAGRVAAARQALADAHRGVAEAEHADRERAVKAAQEGRTTPSARGTAQAKAKLEEAESVLDALTEALGRSADELLGTVTPLLGEAARAATEAHEFAVDRARGLVAAAIEEFGRSTSPPGTTSAGTPGTCSNMTPRHRAAVRASGRRRASCGRSTATPTRRSPASGFGRRSGRHRLPRCHSSWKPDPRRNRQNGGRDEIEGEDTGVKHGPKAAGAGG
jgi:hypothetical protein